MKEQEKDHPKQVTHPKEAFSQHELDEAFSFSMRDEQRTFQENALKIILLVYFSVVILQILIYLGTSLFKKIHWPELIQLSFELAFVTVCLMLIRKGHFQVSLGLFSFFATLAQITSVWYVSPLMFLMWTCAITCSMSVIFTLISKPNQALIWSLLLAAGMYITAYIRIIQSPGTFLFPQHELYTILGFSTILTIVVAFLLRWLKQGFFNSLGKNQEMADKLKWAYSEMLMARNNALEASKVKSQFLANMSHELRTPLNAIIGYTELIQEEAEEMLEEGQDVPFYEDLEKIQHSGRHLLSLISDVLDLTQIESGKVDLTYSKFGVMGFCEKLIQSLQSLAKKQNNTFAYQFAPELETIHSDPVKLRQILTNLIDNACKFTKDGEISLEVRPDTEQEPSSVLFCVKDSGIGMEDEQLKRIFNPFEQADMSSTKAFGGTGLGLTIAQKCAELLGGVISVESQPGQGSTFFVKLPLAPAS